MLDYQKLELFADLVSPLSPITFFKEYFEKKELLLQNRPKNRLNNLLTIQDIDEALLLGIIPVESIKMSQKGYIPHNHWSIVDREVGVLPDAGKIFQELENGNSLILNKLHFYLPKLNRFINQFKRELMCQAWTNIYITPSNFQAFGRHYDTHDVCILQIEGQKMWRLYDTPLILPDESQHYTKTGFDLTAMEIRRELILNKGDFLYIPRGMVHEAVAKDSLSAHITIGFRVPRIIDIVKKLTESAVEQAYFRQTLLTVTTEDHQALEVEIKKKLYQLIATFSFEEILERHRKGIIKERFKTPNDYTLQHIVALNNITENTKIRRRKDVYYNTYLKERIFYVQIDQQIKEYPFFLQPLLESILTTKEGVQITNLVGHFGIKEKIKLVKQLIRDRIITILD